MLNFASHFCFVMVEYLNVCFTSRFWFSGFGSLDKIAFILPFLAVFRVFYDENLIKSVV